jgi:hypothetical protein
MNGARHLEGDGGQRLALGIGVVRISGDVGLVLSSEAVIALPDGHVGGLPESASQPGIAEFGNHGATAELSGLSGKIETAELQELAMVAKGAQVTASAAFTQRCACASTASRCRIKLHPFASIIRNKQWPGWWRHR